MAIRLVAANQPAQRSSPGRSACRCHAAPGSATRRSGAVCTASAALRRCAAAPAALHVLGALLCARYRAAS